MRPGRSGGDAGHEEEPPRDLMCGVTPYIIRCLCDNAWDGGAGMAPTEVGNMTLDQIFMMSVDKRFIRKHVNRRTAPMSALEVTGQAGTDGVVKGRAGDGTAIRGRIAGKSRARQLMEQQASEAKESPRQRRARKRAERSERRKGGTDGS